jgi:hypothetical protein
MRTAFVPCPSVCRTHLRRNTGQACHGTSEWTSLSGRDQMERRMRESALRRCPPGAPLSAVSPHHRLQSDQISYPRASEARFILRSPDPVERLARDIVLSQKEAQLGRMFLDVAHGVQLELEKAHRLPPPPGESNLALCLLV